MNSYIEALYLTTFKQQHVWRIDVSIFGKLRVILDYTDYVKSAVSFVMSWLLEQQNVMRFNNVIAKFVIWTVHGSVFFHFIVKLNQLYFMPKKLYDLYHSAG